MCLDPYTTEIVRKRSSSSKIIRSLRQENITVLLGGNAAGGKLPPLIAQEGKTFGISGWHSKVQVSLTQHMQQ